MLKSQNKLLIGDLLKNLCDMGHGDKVAIVDANYPAHSMGKKVMAFPGISATKLLDAIVSVFPLDHIVVDPVVLMDVTEKDKGIIGEPAIWREFSSIIYDEYGEETNIGKVSREEFYDISRDAFLIIQSGEERLYGNIILVKGVVK